MTRSDEQSLVVHTAGRQQAGRQKQTCDANTRELVCDTRDGGKGGGGGHVAGICDAGLYTGPLTSCWRPSQANLGRPSADLPTTGRPPAAAPSGVPQPAGGCTPASAPAAAAAGLAAGASAAGVSAAGGVPAGGLPAGGLPAFLALALLAERAAATYSCAALAAAAAAWSSTACRESDNQGGLGFGNDRV